MAIKKLFKTAHELIEGYDLGGKKRGESNVWIEGRILKSGNVSLVKVLPHSSNKRKGERVSLGAIIRPEDSLTVKRENEETVRLWKASVDGENNDREREGAGFVPVVKSKVMVIDFIKKVGDDALKQTGNRHSVYATMQSLAKHVEAYAGDSVMFEDVNVNWLRGFIQYLKTDALNFNFTRTTKEGKRQERKISQNSQNRLIRNINFVLNKAVENNYLSRNPMESIPSKEKVKQQTGTREFLTDDEVEKLIATPFTHSPKGNYHIKEAFLFACFSGLRFSDLKTLRMSDFHSDKEGTYIKTKMQKTKKTLRIYLPDVAMTFIPKTDNDEVPIFNLPKNDYSNQSLAKWIKDAGIKDKTVTFHVARHTSATLLLSSGTPLAAIQKQLGHTKAATTEIYADLLDKSQRNAVKAFDKRFGKKGGKK